MHLFQVISSVAGSRPTKVGGRGLPARLDPPSRDAVSWSHPDFRGMQGASQQGDSVVYHSGSGPYYTMMPQQYPMMQMVFTGGQYQPMMIAPMPPGNGPWPQGGVPYASYPPPAGYGEFPPGAPQGMPPGFAQPPQFITGPGGQPVQFPHGAQPPPHFAPGDQPQPQLGQGQSHSEAPPNGNSW